MSVFILTFLGTLNKQVPCGACPTWVRGVFHQVQPVRWNTKISLYVQAVMSDNQNNLDTHGQHVHVIIT
jgi:hypothetical protein